MMIRHEKVSFTSATGERLDARLDRPAGPVRGYALFAHCFTCSKQSLAASRISAGLAERGIATLRFDFTGLGGSEGDFANTGFSSNVDDIIAAANWMKDQGMPAALAIGHSLGGSAILAAADRLPGVAAFATLGAPADAAHVLGQMPNVADEVADAGTAEVCLGGRPFQIGRKFIDDASSARVLEAVGQLRRPLMVLHAPGDQTVGVDHATRLFTAARHPKSFVSLDDADHLITDRTAANFAAAIIAGWAERYLPEDQSSKPPAPTGNAHEVRVAETGSGPYQNWVVAGEHVMLAGEPVALGGDDAGPAPYEWVCAGLGACTSITLRMYATRKTWPLERVSVDVSHEKVDQASAAGGKVDVYTRKISLTGDLTEEQRARLIEIAEKCPVHRSLHNAAIIRTTEST